VPAVACGALGSALAGNERFFPADSSSAQAGLYLASAMAVIAFPVLAWVLTDTGAAQTRIGTLAISAALGVQSFSSLSSAREAGARSQCD